MKNVKKIGTAKAEFAARLNGLFEELPDPVPLRGRQVRAGRIFGVDQKAARKWLKGKGFPTLEKCIDIAEHFSVSLEWLLTGRGGRRLLSNSPEDTALKSLYDAWFGMTELDRRELATYAQFLLHRHTTLSGRSGSSTQIQGRRKAKKPGQKNRVRD